MTLWTKQKVLNEALKFETRFEFRMSSLLAYRAACRHKWLDDVCAHMSNKSTRVKRNTWTKLRVYQEALKYDTRGEFQKHSGRAYNAAWDKGWLDEVCSHMPSKNVRNVWTKDAVLEEASKYTTKSEFHQNSGAAYKAAKDKGCFDEACLHMKHQSRRLSQSDAEERAVERGLKLLSKYNGADHKHSFECCTCNTFETRFSSIYYLDYRCSFCKSKTDR